MGKIYFFKKKSSVFIVFIKKMEVQRDSSSLVEKSSNSSTEEPTIIELQEIRKEIEGNHRYSILNVFCCCLVPIAFSIPALIFSRNAKYYFKDRKFREARLSFRFSRDFNKVASIFAILFFFFLILYGIVLIGMAQKQKLNID